MTLAIPYRPSAENPATPVSYSTTPPLVDSHPSRFKRFNSQVAQKTGRHRRVCRTRIHQGINGDGNLGEWIANLQTNFQRAHARSLFVSSIPVRHCTRVRIHQSSTGVFSEHASIVSAKISPLILSRRNNNRWTISGVVNIAGQSIDPGCRWAVAVLTWRSRFSATPTRWRYSTKRPANCMAQSPGRQT